eukprot:CAMPEP_0167747358 /NCGR_PEP_ID=MMETSP0110_2-20121227/4240_1 /TAXON_ID=629695 /ORGANISM="Gymnochlora sp., Strain CCMP2014" /LENGTH=48 /DNA_ID= /DNA_START= /DNA_END= /DNA_ORIENTATION=
MTSSWWNGPIPANEGLSASTLVLCAQAAYSLKDFFFKDAIADGDVAMW